MRTTNSGKRAPFSSQYIFSVSITDTELVFFFWHISFYDQAENKKSNESSTERWSTKTTAKSRDEWEILKL